jgi:hypothetical protein
MMTGLLGVVQMLVMATIIAAFLLLPGVLIVRAARVQLGGVRPNLPQAKIHDGRPFGRPRWVGRSAAYPVALALGGFLIVLGASGLAVSALGLLFVIL